MAGHHVQNPAVVHEIVDNCNYTKDDITFILKQVSDKGDEVRQSTDYQYGIKYNDPYYIYHRYEWDILREIEENL